MGKKTPSNEILGNSNPGDKQLEDSQDKKNKGQNFWEKMKSIVSGDVQSNDKPSNDSENKTEGELAYADLRVMVQAQRNIVSKEAAADLMDPIVENTTLVNTIHEEEGIQAKGGLMSGVADPVTQKDPDTRIDLDDPDKPLTNSQAKKGAASMKDAIAKRNDDTKKAVAVQVKAKEVEVAEHSNKNKDIIGENSAKDDNKLDTTEAAKESITDNSKLEDSAEIQVAGRAEQTTTTKGIIEDVDSLESLEEGGEGDNIA